MPSQPAEYGEILLDHFDNPRNAGDVERPDATGRAANPACGDTLVITLRVRDGCIEQARFRASGCGASIASSSMLTVMLTGVSLDEARALTNEDVARELGGLPPAKLHCSVLAEEAIRDALEDLARRGAAAT